MGGWSTLFDVANVAMNISQSAQLAEQRTRLEGLRGQAAAEALRQRLIETMRNFVFASGEQLKVLAEYKEEASQAVFAAASIMAWKFRAGGVTPEVFPEFRDKEYVQEVRSRLQDTLEDAQSRLSADEVQEGERCVEAIIQMPLLNEAIGVQSASEALEETRSSWEQLESVRKDYTKKGWIVGLGAQALAACLLMVGPVLAFSGDSTASGLGGFLTCASVFVVPVGGIIAGLILGSKGKTAEWRKLKKEREALQERVPEQSRVQEMQAALGIKTSEEYGIMRAERENLIHRVMAKTEGFALSADLLASVSLETQ